MKKLSNKIDINTIKEKELFQMWNSIAPILKFKYIVDERSVDGAIANKYKFDFEGLLINEFKIHKEFIYPTILVNGYSSSTDYNGETKRILIIDDKIMYDYLRMFIRNIDERKKLS